MLEDSIISYRSVSLNILLTLADNYYPSQNVKNALTSWYYKEV